MPKRIGLTSTEHARRIAKRRLPGSVYNFIEGGTEAGTTVRANKASFEEIGFRPRIAQDHNPRDLRTTVLGREMSMPVITTPAGFIRVAHPEGELAVARAAEKAGIAVGISILASVAIEEITAAASDVWFQLYMIGGREGSEIAIERAKRAGVRVLLVTADLADNTGGNDRKPSPPPPGKVDLRTAIKFAPEMITHPTWAASFLRGGLQLVAPNAPVTNGGAPMAISEGSAAIRRHPPTWDDIAYIRELWDGPLVVKGVSSTEDARRAVDIGANAVSVSNHGGNGLDGAPATIRALPEIVDAVGDQLEVLLDGGVRRGGDVVKAVALGARAVLIGRPYIWALAAGGEGGVDELLTLFRRGIDGTLRLLACPSVADLSPAVLWMPECQCKCGH
ncbi:MAG: Alpha-hydroxy-acid oxidizing enzyme [Pseudonocardiales bacterium]|nr:Alpha-hydroxy-acid oxidizing enzyme [Pseudonocardiales bacterium]